MYADLFCTNGISWIIIAILAQLNTDEIQRYICSNLYWIDAELLIVFIIWKISKPQNGNDLLPYKGRRRRMHKSMKGIF